MAVNALTYIKNVGKSAGYVSFNVVKNMNPVLKEFAETNADVTTTAYRTVRDLKKNIKRMPEVISESEYGKLGKSLLDNIMDDLKTGKFYNKERENQFEANAANVFAGLDEGFGDLDDLNFDDMGFDEDEEIDSNEMMDIVGEKASVAVSTAMARSSEYIVESNIQIARSNSKHMNALYSGIHGGMATINQNLAKVIEFSNEQVITHFENSRTFYEKITSLDEERNQLLKNINENLNKINEPVKDTDIKKSNYSKVTDYEGILDINNYLNVVKDNINSNTGGVFDILKMMSETTGLQNLIASPLSFAIESVIQSVIPNVLKKSMDNFNQSISGLFANGMMWLNNKANNDESGIWRNIANIFGVQPSARRDIDVAKYEKGKVPFDGITRKSIVEVIPTYLSKILSAISGRKEDRFDYDNGKFETVEKLREKHNQRTNTHASSAASELTDTVKKNINKLNLDENQQKDLMNDWEQIVQYMYRNNTNFNTNNKDLSGSDFNLYGDNSDLNVKLLQHLIGEYGRTENMKYANRLYRERENQSQEVQTLQNSTTYNTLYNNSETDTFTNNTGIKSVIDNVNNAVVTELVNIRKEVTYIKDIMLQYGPGFRRKKKANKRVNKVSTTSIAVDSAANSSNESDSDDEESDGDSEPPASLSIEDIAARIISEGSIKYNAEQKEKESKEKDIIIDGFDDEGKPKKKKRKSIFDRIRSFKKGSKELIGVPLNFMSAVIEKADKRLYDMVFGYDEKSNDDEESNGLLSKLFDNIDDTFDDFSSYLHEKILDPLSDKVHNLFDKDNIMDGLRKVFKMFDSDLDKTIESVKDFFFDPKDSLKNFFDDYKQDLKSALGWGKSAVKDVAEWAGASTKPEKTESGEIKSALNNEIEAKKKKVKDLMNKNAAKKVKDEFKDDDNQGPKTFATGIERVDKTGLAVISEGEMIIPPDMNPFNISKRKRNEKKIKQNLKNGIDSIYEYATGKQPDSFDTLTGDNKNQKLSKEEQESLKTKIGNRLIKMYSDRQKKNKLTEEDYTNGQLPIQERVAEEIANGASVIKERVVDEIVGRKEDNDKFKENALDFISNTKQYGSSMAAGATIGAGVSVLTGLVGGPLVGAAVGAGTGLIIKSEAVQEMLFGKNVNGERQGGLLSKELSNNINKYLPDMAKGSTVGGIISSIIPFVPGGPITGVILGSALGFAKNNQSIQDVLFGEDTLLGTKEQFQNKVRSVLPKMGAGALAGLLAGPFGVGTNVLLGSALGFAADTKTFKDLLLGEEDESGKRSGGFIGKVADFIDTDIIDPVRRAKDPILNQFRLIGEKIKDVFTNIFSRVGDKIKDTFDKIIGERIKNVLSKVFSTIGGGIKKIVSLPFQAIGKVGDFFRTKDIKKGQATYMKGAETRNLYRQSEGDKAFGIGDLYKEFDESTANIKDTENIEKLAEAMSVIKDSKKNIKDVYKESQSNINSAFKESDVNKTIKKHTLELIKLGKYEEAEKYIKESNIEDNTKQSLIKTIAKESSRMKMTRQMRENSTETSRELLESMESMGLKMSPSLKKKIAEGGSEARNAYKLLLNEIEYRKEVKDDPFKKKETTENDDNNSTAGAINNLNKDELERHKGTIEKFDSALDLLRQQVDINSEIYKATLNKQENIYNAIGGVSDNPEADLSHRNDPDIRPENLFEDIKNKAYDTKSRYNEKGIIGGTIGVGLDLSKEGLKLSGKVAKTITDIAGFIVGGAIDFAKDVGHSGKELYKSARHSEAGERIFGDKNLDWWNKNNHVVASEGEVKINPNEVKNNIDDIPEAAEGKVNETDNAQSLYGIWGNISKYTQRIAASVLAKAHMDGIDTSKIPDNDNADDFLTKINNKYKDGAKSTTQFVNGLPIKMIRDKNGEWVPDPSNSENDDNFKIINSERETQSGILNSIRGMTNSLDNVIKDLFSDDEEDEDDSWLSKIFNFFTGAGNAINNFKTMISTVLSSVISAAIPVGLAIAVSKGVFDNLLSRITDGAYGKKDANDKIYVKDKDGNSTLVQTDKDGNPITDENGNYVTADGESVDGSLENHGSLLNMSGSNRVMYSIARGVASGHLSTLGKIIKRTKIGRPIYKVASKVTSLIGNAKINKIADASKLESLYELIGNSVTKWKGALKHVPVLSKYVDKFDDLAEALIQFIKKNLGTDTATISSASKSFSKALSYPILIATITVDFTTGYQDASNILRINPKYVTFEQKIICGLVRTIKNFIPFIGTFISDISIADFFIDYVASWFGKDVSALKEQRSEAEDELEEYNNAHPNDKLTWTEYNKQVNGTYTWTEKIGNKVRSTFTNVKQFFNKNKASETSQTSTNNTVSQTSFTGSGSGLPLKLVGRGTDETFVSQVDPKYKNQQFNIPGDTQRQTLGNTGCAPAAAVMAINATMGSKVESMENAAKKALNYKVNDDGVSADYFSDQFASHGISAKYIENGSSTSIMNELMQQNKVVLMGKDENNTSKKISPFGANPHYVVATGISKDGKSIYINDPESNVPNVKYDANKILRSSSLGIAAKVANGTKKITNKLRRYIGRGSYGSDTAQYKVWNALRNAGYNEISTAAAMGNIEHESHFDPALIEKGSGVGFGLVQWSYGRRTAFENYANSKGVSPSDLSIQIEYLLKELEPNSGIWTKASSKYKLGSFSRDDWANGTNLDTATKAFMCCFERPSYDPDTNHINKRLQAAADYYTAFTGTKVDANTLKYSILSTENSLMGVNNTYNSSSDDSSTLNSSTGIFGLLTNAFGKLASSFGLGDIFGTNSSSSDESTYSNNSTVSNKSTTTIPSLDGNVSSNPEHAELQKALVKKMYSVQGQLKYAQDNAKYPGSRNPEDGSGDCSSTVKWAYQNVLGVNPGDWTGAQRDNENTYTVTTNLKDESKLQLGDLLLKDGHVEMYAGNGKMIGHGSDNGPKEKALDTSGGYNLVRRWVGFQDKYAASGSGLTNEPVYNKALKHVTQQSPKSTIPINLNEVTQTQNDAIEFNNNKVKAYASGTKAKHKFIGRATDITQGEDPFVKTDDNVKMSSLISIIQEIVSLLVKVVTNTNQLTEIVRLMNIVIGNDSSANSNQTNANDSNSTDSKKESTILAKQSLINTINNTGASSEVNQKLLKLIEESERIARL